MTSPNPASVTCLACREHAHREYLRFADRFERLGATVTGDEMTEAAERLRDLARRFSGR